MNMRLLLLSKLITFQLPAVKTLLAVFQAIPLQLLFLQLNSGVVLRLLLHKQQFKNGLLGVFFLFFSFLSCLNLENDRM